MSNRLVKQIFAHGIGLILILCPSRVAAQGNVQSGLDVVVANGFKDFRGKSVGLITNQTGVDRRGRHGADLFHAASGVKLSALFGPEHGIRGQVEGGESIGFQVDSATGLVVHSLYGATRKPALEMLIGIDALVFDIQDVGARFYTYISTMALAMEAAAEADLEFYVLDRPNPIAELVEGPILDPKHRSFVGIHPIALRHGMTAGELASMFLGEGWMHTNTDSSNAAPSRKDWSKLHVIKMENWRRNILFGETGLPWIAPSPNMISPHTALLYPGMGLLEATNFSEGRGTSSPFELVGAPWLDSTRLIEMLRPHAPGIELQPEDFTSVDLPGKAMNPKFENQLCHGMRVRVLEAAKFESVKFGLTLIWALQRLHPKEFIIHSDRMARMAGNEWVAEMILSGEELSAILNRVREDERSFRALRQKYLLYE